MSKIRVRTPIGAVILRAVDHEAGPSPVRFGRLRATSISFDELRDAIAAGTWASGALDAEHIELALDIAKER